MVSSTFNNKTKGNVFALLFAAVGLTGVLGVVGMQTVSGPVRTITKVTQKNITDTDLMTNARVMILNASTLPDSGDADGDGYIEPAPYRTSNCSVSPTGGGCLPDDVGAVLTDPWGTPYGYCVWDHGATTNGKDDAGTGTDNRLNGESTTSQPVLAVMSAGVDKTFQTECGAFGDGGTEGLNDPEGAGDDVVRFYSYEAALAGSGGLWSENTGDAVIANPAVTDEVIMGGGASIDIGGLNTGRAGTGSFPAVRADVITSYTAMPTPVEMDTGLRLVDNSYSSCDAGNSGVLRYNAGNVEYCNGSSYQILSTEGVPWKIEDSDHGGNTSITVAGTDNSANTDIITMATAGSSRLIISPAGLVSITNDADIDGTLNVDGNTTLASDLTVDTNTLVVDSTNDMVGIGKTPDTSGDGAEKLQVAGNVQANYVDALRWRSPSRQSQSYWDWTAGNRMRLRLATRTFIEAENGVDLTIELLNESDGDYITMGDNNEFYADLRQERIGLGTDSPAERLHVVGSALISDDLSVTNSGSFGGNLSVIGNITAGGTVGLGNGTCSANGQLRYTAGDKVEYCESGAWQSFNQGVAQLVDIGDVSVTADDNDGWVLIWDATDGEWRSANPSGITTGTATTAGSAGKIIDDDDDTQIQVEENSDEDKIRFDTAGAQRMVIDENGNVGIGLASPTSPLDVRSNTFGGGEDIVRFISAYGRSITLEQPDSDNDNPFVWNTNNSHAWDVDGNRALTINEVGQVAIGTDNPGGAVDYTGVALMEIQGNNPSLILDDTVGTSDDNFRMVNGGYYVNFINETTSTEIMSVNMGDPSVFMGADVSSDYDASAYLQIQSANKGFLPPRIADPSTDVTTPAAGLIAYDSTDNQLQVYNGVEWIALGGSGGDAGRLIDADSDTSIEVDTAGDGSDNTTVFTNNGAESMRIAADGKVGIGTATPSEKLDVEGGSAVLPAPGTAAVDGNLATSQWTLWTDEANDELEVKLKDSADNIQDHTLVSIANRTGTPSCAPAVNNVQTSSMLTQPGNTVTISGYAVPSVTSPILVVAVAMENDQNSSPSLSSVTFAGSPLSGTSYGQDTRYQDKASTIQYLLAPTGTGDIVVTVDEDVESLEVAAYTLSCVAQQAPSVTSAGGGQSLSSISDTVTINNPAIIIDSLNHGASVESSLSVSEAPDQILIYKNETTAGATSTGASSYRVETASGTYTMGWTSGSSNELAYMITVFDTLSAASSMQANLNLDGLSDVNAPSPTADDALVYNGSQWVAGSVSNPSGLIDADSDTSITVDTAGDGSDNTTVFTNNGNETMRLTDNNMLLYGTDDPTDDIGAATNPSVKFYMDNDMWIRTYSDSASTKSDIDFQKAGGSESSPTAISDGDYLSNIRWSGYNGSDWVLGIAVGPIVNGTVTGSEVPMDMQWRMGASNNEVMRLTSDGNLGIGTPTPADILTLLGGKMSIRETDDENDAVHIGAGSTTGYITLMNGGTDRIYLSSGTTNDTFFNAGPVVFGNTTADASAKVQIDSSNTGFLPPRIADPAGDVTTPATGLIAYDSTDNQLQLYNGTAWVALADTGGSVNEIDDLSDGYTTSSSVHLGSGIPQAATQNVVVGQNAMVNATGGYSNVFVGWEAGGNAGSTGDFNRNTVIGGRAGSNLGTNSDENILLGYRAAYNIGAGSNQNIVMGNGAGGSIAGGDNNIVIGYGADTSGGSNEMNIGDTIFGNLTTNTVGIGVTDATAIGASAILDLTSTTLGFLPPRIADPSADVSSPATGLIAYDSTDNQLQVYNGSSWVGLGGGVADDSLDFAQFEDQLNLDASTDINIDSTNNYALSITNEGTSNSFTVNDEAGDATPFVINSSGKVGINGGTSGDVALKIGNGGGDIDHVLRVMTEGISSGSSLDAIELYGIDANTSVDFRWSSGFGTVATQEVYSGGSGNPDHMEIGVNTASFRVQQMGTNGVSTAAGHIDYTVNKSSGGNDTGLLISKTDTNSPGTSLLINAETDSVSQFWLDDEGLGYLRTGMVIGNTTKEDSAILQADSTSLGFLPPRIADPSADVSSPATGLIAYDSTDNQLQLYNGTEWVALADTGGSVNEIDDLSDAYHSTDIDHDGDSNATNDDNLALGHQFPALDGTNPGARNTAIGRTALAAVTEGDDNIAIGFNSGIDLTTGFRNTFIGQNSGRNITTGVENVLIGAQTSWAIPSDLEYATALGHGAGRKIGNQTTAIGHSASATSTGDREIGGSYLGYQAGGRADDYSTGIGWLALKELAGENNTAVGAAAGRGAGSGGETSANGVYLGYYAGSGLTTGNNNIFMGYQAGDATTTGADNILIGYDVDASSATASNELNIGNTIFGDLANGYVGIGTNTTSDFLTIKDDSDTANGIRVVNGAGNTRIRLDISQYNNGELRVTNAAGVETFLAGNTLVQVNTSRGLLIGDGPTDSSALLNIVSTDKGFLPPRIADPAGDVTTPATGLIAYDSTDNQLQLYNGTAWVALADTGGSVNEIDDLSDAYNSTDIDHDGDADATNDDNLALGHQFPALNGTSPGARNTAIGRTALSAVTTGDDNIAMGYGAGQSLDTGRQNSIVGVYAGRDLTSGNGNTAFGYQAGRDLAAALRNTAIGRNSALNTIGDQNTAVGDGALYRNTTGVDNTVVGYNALTGTTNGEVNANTVFGARAGSLIESGGDNNVLIGYQAGDVLTTGTNNLIIGYDVDPSSATATNELNIGNTIFGDMSTGNVGVGVNNPNDKMTILGSSPSGPVTLRIQDQSSSGAHQARLAFNLSSLYTNNNNLGVNLLATRVDTPSNGSSDFEIQTSTGTSNMATKLIVKADGRIGIGTTSPDASAIMDLTSTSLGFLAPRMTEAQRDAIATPATGLQVYNTDTNTHDYYNGSSWISFSTGATTATQVVDADGDTKIQVEETDDDDIIRFDVGGGQVMALYPSALPGASVGEGFFVEPNDNHIMRTYIKNSSSTNGSTNLVFGAAWGTTNYAAIGTDGLDSLHAHTMYLNTEDDRDIKFSTNDTERVRILGSNGYVGIGTDAPTAELDVAGDIQYSGVLTDTSDRRLKKDIHKLDTDDIVDRLARIDTYSFKMIGDPLQRSEMGVMAQELEEIFPELVHTADDEMGTKSVNYMGLIAPMIEASKALKSENDELKAEMAALKAQNDNVLASINTLKTDVNSLKAHTGVGLSQANSMMTIFLLFLTCGLAGIVVIQRQKHLTSKKSE